MELLLKKRPIRENDTNNKGESEPEAQGSKESRHPCKTPLQLAAENENWWLVGMMLGDGVDVAENALNEEQLLTYTVKFLDYVDYLDQMNKLQERVDRKREMCKDNISDAR